MEVFQAGTNGESTLLATYDYPGSVTREEIIEHLRLGGIHPVPHLEERLRRKRADDEEIHRKKLLRDGRITQEQYEQEKAGGPSSLRQGKPIAHPFRQEL